MYIYLRCQSGSMGRVEFQCSGSLSECLALGCLEFMVWEFSRVLLFCSGNAGGERERGRFSIVLMQVIHVILALLATKAGVGG